MKDDLISIIIPIYKVEKYIERCINSVLSQTYSNIEIILIDDGSPDMCPSICDNYKLIDSRIQVIHKENGGLSDARNKGINISKGKYITFVDSDDYIENDYVEFLYKTILKEDSDIAICSYQSVYGNRMIIKQLEHREYILNSEETLEKMLYQKEFNVSAWAKLYKRELFENIEFPKGKIFEDAFTTYKLVMKAKKISVNLEIKYNYMIRSNSILTSEFNEKKMLLIDAYNKMGRDIQIKYPKLTNAVIRAEVYANISTLRQMIFAKNRLIDDEKKIRKFIVKNRKHVLYNKECAFRDKVAIILICININIFKVFWIIYCRITGRIYN